MWTWLRALRRTEDASARNRPAYPATKRPKSSRRPSWWCWYCRCRAWLGTRCMCTARSHAIDMALAPYHDVCDFDRTSASRQYALFAHGAERGMTKEEGVDAFGVEDVVAWELAHLCFVDFKIVHADWTCRLRPRGRHARCRYCGCRRVAGQRSPLVASLGIYSGMQKPECLIRHM